MIVTHWGFRFMHSVNTVEYINWFSFINQVALPSESHLINIIIIPFTCHWIKFLVHYSVFFVNILCWYIFPLSCECCLDLISRYDHTINDLEWLINFPCLILIFLRFIFMYIYEYGYFACIYVYGPYVCLVHIGVREGVRSPGLSYRWLLAVMWVLRTKRVFCKCSSCSKCLNHLSNPSLLHLDLDIVSSLPSFLKVKTRILTWGFFSIFQTLSGRSILFPVTYIYRNVFCHSGQEVPKIPNDFP